MISVFPFPKIWLFTTQSPMRPNLSNTLRKSPASVPSTTASSNRNTFLLTCIFPAKRGISPTDISTVKTPPAANMPKLVPTIPKNICLRNVNCLPLPIRSLNQRIVHIFFVDTHFYLNRRRVFRNPPAADMVKEYNNPHCQTNRIGDFQYDSADMP